MKQNGYVYGSIGKEVGAAFIFLFTGLGMKVRAAGEEIKNL